MKLSERLKAVAAFVDEGMRVADVGTDHGYVPIYLLEQGICPCAIASDINEGPLKRARRHIKKHDLEEKIQIRLSDGLQEYLPGEADCLVLAGMGGGLMIDILKGGTQVLASMREAVLEPQSEVQKVREWLKKEGYDIVAENMVEEDGKYYPIIKIQLPANLQKKGNKGKRDKMAEEMGFRYGALLLQSANPVLKSYLHKEYEQKQVIMHELQKQGLKNTGRKVAVMKEMMLIMKVLETYYSETDL